MEWHTIPGFEVYEINRKGKVRRRGSHYVMPVRGRRVRLCKGPGQYVSLLPDELLAMTFDVSSPAADADELHRLRGLVAELEAELAVYRVEF